MTKSKQTKKRSKQPVGPGRYAAVTAEVHHLHQDAGRGGPQHAGRIVAASDHISFHSFRSFEKQY